jgi:uncharacterized RDD family membrane protein YckC
MIEMPADPTPSPAAERTPIAGFWRRLAALLVDYLILAVPTAMLGFAAEGWVSSLGQSGRLIGFTVALLYFGLLNSVLGGGRTIGKRWFGIRVIDRSGKALSPIRSIARYLVIAVPFFLNGVWFDVDAGSAGPMTYALGILLGFLVFGGLGATVYLFIFNRRTRQSLHDLAVGSFVVRGEPVPIGLATPRVHLIIAGCWLVLALIGPGIGLEVMRQSSIAQTLKPLADLQSTIRARQPVQRVKVLIGTSMFASTHSGTTTVSYLQVEVQPTDPHKTPDALEGSIAGTVLDRDPDLLGRQILVVIVHRRLDLGLVNWDDAKRTALDAAAWREKLTGSNSPPLRL